MAALFALDRSLVIRYGNITYQFNRMLTLATGQAVQFENQLTGEYKNFDLTAFYRDVQHGILVPVLGDATDFSRTDDGQPIPAVLDLSALSPKPLEELTRRERIVKYIRKLGISRGRRTEITKAIEKHYADRRKKDPDKPPEKIPSASTVMGWLKLFESSGRNIASLLNGNSHRARKTTVHPLVEEAITWAFDKHYLTRSRHSLQHAYDELQRRLKELVAKKRLTPKEATVSMATFQRRKEELDTVMVTTRRLGSTRDNHDHRVTMAGTTVRRAMQRYEVDHTLLNWVVVCDRTGMPLGRPTITVVVDSYSGYVCGLYISFNGPGITSVLKVIKNCIRPKADLVLAAAAVKPWLAWGVPDCLILDNGLEFHSHAFRLAAWDLSVDLEYCRVRTPWLKPHVERFFANLDFFTLNRGRVRKPENNVLNIDPKLDAAITLSDFCRGMLLYICDIHNQRPNSRTLEIPCNRFSESLLQNPPPFLPATTAGLDLIAAMSKNLTVAQGGVELLGLSYAGYELKELIAAAGGKFKTLCKWDPEDMGEMFVQHPRTSEWLTLQCTRSDYANGLTWNQHRILKSFTRKTLKLDGTVDHLLGAQWRLTDLWMEPIARKNRSLDAEQAKKYAALTNSHPFTPMERPVLNPPKKIIAVEELAYEASDIPTFATFSLR